MNQFDLRVTREGDYVCIRVRMPEPDATPSIDRTLRSLRELLFGVLDALDT